VARVRGEGDHKQREREAERQGWRVCVCVFDKITRERREGEDEGINQKNALRPKTNPKTSAASMDFSPLSLSSSFLTVLLSCLLLFSFS